MKNNRSTGRTTKQIDNYIQALFTNLDKAIVVIDHSNTYYANADLVKKIEQRLSNEHSHKGLKLGKGIINNYHFMILSLSLKKFRAFVELEDGALVGKDSLVEINLYSV